MNYLWPSELAACDGSRDDARAVCKQLCTVRGWLERTVTWGGVGFGGEPVGRGAERDA